MERKAWFCPSCNKYHAPHVETCPGPVDAINTTPMPKVRPGANPNYDPCANCNGACGNAACPKRFSVTCYTMAHTHPPDLGGL